MQTDPHRHSRRRGSVFFCRIVGPAKDIIGGRMVIIRQRDQYVRGDVPLTEETYNAYIPAIDLIDTDAEAAVRLIVTLATSTGTEDFIYQIK